MQRFAVVSVVILLVMPMSHSSLASSPPTSINLTSVKTTDSGSTYTIDGVLHTGAKCIAKRSINLTHGGAAAASIAKTGTDGKFSFTEPSSYMSANTGDFVVNLPRKVIHRRGRKTTCAQDDVRAKVVFAGVLARCRGVAVQFVWASNGCSTLNDLLSGDL